VGPFDGLDEGWKFDDLAAQRAIEDPSGANGNLRGTALRSAEYDLDTDVTRANAGDRCDVVEEDKNRRSEYQGDTAEFQQPWEARDLRVSITTIS